MTLSINKRFVWDGITVTISLPPDYDGQRAYPAVLLNDGHLDYLKRLAQSAILIGLEAENRLDDYTPWIAKALRPDAPDFGGRADSYHQKLFYSIIPEISQHYRLDESRMAYGGYSLGGLAAVYSLYGHDRIPCIFSICGSFWYPGFTDFCRRQSLRNKDCLVYLQNGKTEGAKHSNRLAQAPLYAEEVHHLIQKQLPHTYSHFDPHGHHEALKERYGAFADWLLQQWSAD